MLKPSDIQVSELPHVHFENRIELPKSMGIYFVLDKYKNPLYIGKSTNIWQRWKIHHKLETLKSIENLTISWLEVSEAVLLNSTEAALIQWFQPPLNTRLHEQTNNQYRGKRNSVTFPVELSENIQTLADKENRTFSQMVVQLCSEAIKKRQEFDNNQ